MEGVRRIDMFRYLPSKMAEQTVFGSLFTLAMIVLSGIFIFHEVDGFTSGSIETKLIFADLKVL